MNRRTSQLTSVTILAMIALSGTALAQSQTEPLRDSVRIAEQSSEMKTSLARAITIAEKHSKGVVIGIRLTGNQDTFRTMANGLEQNQDNRSSYSTRSERDGKNQTDTRDRDDRNNPENYRDSSDRESENDNRDSSDRDDWKTTRDSMDQNTKPDDRRRAGQPGSANERGLRNADAETYAIVTCVIDRTRVRDVVIDMSDGSVIGMQSANAWGRSMRSGEAQEVNNDPSRLSLVRASDLLNATARNAQDERVGDIDELVMDPESHRVLYAVLRRGGFLGINEARYALPASEITAPNDGQILVNLNSSDFENRAGFDDDKWPTRGDQQLSKNSSRNAQMPQSTRIAKATDLIGTEVKSSDGRTIGDIVDLIVEPSTGQVVYAIVDCDHGNIVVPMAAITTMGKVRRIEMTQSDVQALPTLGARTEPDWNDAQWNRRMHENFGAEMTLKSASARHTRR